MRLSKSDVEHVAFLARLELNETEVERLTDRMNQIMLHFEKLQQLDTTGIVPTSHSIPVTNVFREDVAGPSLTPEEAVSNAPMRNGGYFVVPQIVEI
ncbi:MAG TPA: Asp-tRNA(Asn)/Glu-tRNA(Gln) amidotransferase subunit GatC [Armatimonadota bacterium]|jgi:aspartyl-tRNA(Asn)/glutamyl-tRNA(Gln) amidotransferase subunit C